MKVLERIRPSEILKAAIAYILQQPLELDLTLWANDITLNKNLPERDGRLNDFAMMLYFPPHHHDFI